MTKDMIMMWGVISEMEREIISQRVKSGMKKAVVKGKQVCRPELTKDNLLDKFWKYYQIYQENQITNTEFARMMQCTRATIYKFISLD